MLNKEVVRSPLPPPARWSAEVKEYANSPLQQFRAQGDTWEMYDFPTLFIVQQFAAIVNDPGSGR